MKKSNIFWTEEELAILKKNYCKPDGIEIIRKLLPHRGYNSIKGMANVRFGLRRKPVYTKNDNFFSIPNDINNTIAGFIAADGCISEKEQRLTIKLSSKDSKYLEIIKDNINYTGNLYLNTSKEHSIFIKGKWYIIKPSENITLQINKCPQIISDLNTHWNITPRKTNTLQPPNIKNLRHIMCYLTGLIDGDGWICLNKTSDSKHGKVLEISVMGTIELMTWVKKIFDYLTPGQTRVDIKPTSSPNGAVFTLRGTRAYIIAKLFLSLDIPRLERKWSAAKEYIELLDNLNGITPKMDRWIKLSGFDLSLLDIINHKDIVINF